MKKETKTKIPVSIGPELRYRADSSAWGLMAYYHTYTLVFPLSPQISGMRKLKIKRFFSALLPAKKPKGVFIPKLNLHELLSDSARDAIKQSYRHCGKRGGKEISVEDIFLALLKAPSVLKLLKRLRVDPKQAEKLIKNYLKFSPPLCGPVVNKIPFEAFALSVKLHNHKVGSLMLLGALLKATPHENILQAIFSNIGLTTAKLELFAVWLLDLNHEFPQGTTSDKLLYTLRQAEGLEKHFGYFFDFSAIDAATDLAEQLGDKKRALAILARSASLARQRKTKIISAQIVSEANK